MKQKQTLWARFLKISNENENEEQNTATKKKFEKRDY